MPRLKSSFKRMKQEKKARERNRRARAKMKKVIKKVRKASDKEKAQQALNSAIPVIDKTARKGIIHKNTASRYKSRLTKLVNRLG